MKFRLFLTLTGILALFAAETAAPQTVVKGVHPDDMFNVPEPGALILAKDKAAVVEAAMPAERRLERYRKVDIRQGDVVVMMNAQKIKTVKDIKRIYDRPAAGQDVKFGVQRGGEMQPVSFVKADPADLPKQKMMQMAVGAPGAKIAVPGGPGLALEEAKKGMKAAELPPGAPDFVKESEIKKNDYVLAINGKDVKTQAEAETLFDSTKTGSPVTVRFKQGGADKSFTGKKPAAGGMIIKKTITGGK